jgi:hypothetical protein
VDAEHLELTEDLGATHTVEVGSPALGERVNAICGGVNVATDTTPGAT